MLQVCGRRIRWPPQVGWLLSRWVEDVSADNARAGRRRETRWGYHAEAARDGKVVHLDVYGVQDLATKKPATTDTIFRIASNLLSRDALYAELGDPKTDAERLRRISPLFHAEQIKVPLMVLQGRPTIPECCRSSRMKNGVPVEYIVFADEGHGFVKKDNESRDTAR